MIVVDYLKLKKVEIEFDASIVKYKVFKTRRDLEYKKIKSVYPDCESIDDIPNKDVIRNIKYLVNKTEKTMAVCLKKLDNYNHVKADFIETLIG